jgi:hypothetical protein
MRYIKGGSIKATVVADMVALVSEDEEVIEGVIGGITVFVVDDMGRLEGE